MAIRQKVYNLENSTVWTGIRNKTCIIDHLWSFGNQYKVRNFPANTHDLYTTSHERRRNVMTLRRRLFDVV